jgi:cytochrome P450
MATAARKYDLYSDAFRADTYATFARMREQDPVLCQPGLDGETSIWFVTRYDDAEAVLRDNVRFAAGFRSSSPSSTATCSTATARTTGACAAWSPRRSRRG